MPSPENYLELEGKIAIVTGGSRGIGRAIVKKLLENGAKVAFNSLNPDGEDGKQLVAEHGENVLWVPGDISQKETCEQLVEGTKAKFSGVHILVCCAGITEDGIFMRMKDESFDHVYQVKAGSARMLTQMTFMHMRRAGWGRIAYMSSIAADGSPGQVNYAMANAALIGLAKSVALIAPDIISANAVLPALVDTDMTSAERLAAKYRDQLIALMPIGRKLTAREIADATYPLISQKTPVINGQTIYADGGMLRR